ncbi:uncharacterized protein TRIADDRAFT_52501 [Trichoplax adhaerens]|uniref:NudC domain-containing protein 1 n=1 Tax=Trichoplax adhaerens TaxID=10228 RepID=B3RIR7_TRIAD|nr:hypothetical protein TRIADDRAFT_52501 [Trichoplax adhaerens]EDV29028.1 hypothetical protein TRIADDRAFT_52501 [Trichoplax adhaerens]|eukprot:XP_002108230.1 hypothetical protein TRIADDRAFT_52501 [Trichoplax adhaerens]
MALLEPNRNLINRNFEGYKLSPDEPLVLKLKLEVNVRALAASSSQISFEEVRLYSTCNHLMMDCWYSDPGIDHLYFINESWEVAHIEFDSKDGTSFIECPFQVPLNAVAATDRHNLSMQFPSKKHALISDGVDKIYLLDRHVKKWKILGIINYERPCTLLHAVCDDKQDKCQCYLIEFKRQDFKIEPTSKWIEITIPTNHQDSCNYNIVLQIRGQCVPLFGGICPISRKLILIHEKELIIERCEISDADDKMEESASYEKSNSMLNENLLPEYIWTQSADTVVVNFVTPYNIKPTDVVFSLTTKEILLGLVDGLIFLKGELHDKVDVDGCTWILQDNGAGIQLTLEKHQPFHVWSTVVEECTRGKQAIGEVDEIHQRLAHLTSDQWNPQPNTAENRIFQLDRSEDCDELSQDNTTLSVASPTSKSFDKQIALGCNQWLFNAPILPYANMMPAFCLRHDTDAFLWQFQANPDISFTHTSTFDAFGYVQASKRDRKFISCSPSSRFVVICDYARNVYIYMKSTSEDQPLGKHSFQRIVALDSEKIMGLVASHNFIYVLSNCGIYCIKV